jgi:hypothetical protein
MIGPLINVIKNTYKKIIKKNVIRYNKKRIGAATERKLAQLFGAVSPGQKNTSPKFPSEEINDKIRVVTG